MDKIKNIILENINKFDIQYRKPKFSNSYYLDKIIYVLKTGINWKDIDCLCHYTSIYKKYIRWCNLNIFHISWQQITKEYINRKLIKKIDWFSTLIIDSSMIKNYKGIDFIGKNHYDRFRNATKISIICDTNKIPLSVSFYGANIHDTKTIENSIINLKNNLKTDNRRNINLVADKGYILNETNKKQIYKKYKVKLITPSRKNGKKKNSAYEKKLLEIRWKIEHIFNDLDKLKRIKDRYEKLLNSYASFTYLGIIIKYHKILLE